MVEGGELETRARAAYRALTDRPGPKNIPTEEQIVDLVLGRLSADERDRVADAIVASPSLAGSVRELMAVHAEAGPRLEGRRVPVASRRTWIWAAAAAAVVIIGLGLAPVVLRNRPVVDSAIRNRLAEPAFQVEPPHGATLRTAPETLGWSIDGETPDARISYAVVLYDFESTVLWRIDGLSNGTVELPQAVQARMQPGRDYFWRISRRAGLEEERSPLLRFQIQP